MGAMLRRLSLAVLAALLSAPSGAVDVRPIEAPPSYKETAVHAPALTAFFPGMVPAAPRPASFPSLSATSAAPSAGVKAWAGPLRRALAPLARPAALSAAAARGAGDDLAEAVTGERFIRSEGLPAAGAGWRGAALGADEGAPLAEPKVEFLVTLDRDMIDVATPELAGLGFEGSGSPVGNEDYHPVGWRGKLSRDAMERARRVPGVLSAFPLDWFGTFLEGPADWPAAQAAHRRLLERLDALKSVPGVVDVVDARRVKLREVVFLHVEPAARLGPAYGERDAPSPVPGLTVVVDPDASRASVMEGLRAAAPSFARYRLEAVYVEKGRAVHQFTLRPAPPPPPPPALVPAVGDDKRELAALLSDVPGIEGIEPLEGSAVVVVNFHDRKAYDKAAAVSALPARVGEHTIAYRYPSPPSAAPAPSEALERLLPELLGCDERDILSLARRLADDTAKDKLFREYRKTRRAVRLFGLSALFCFASFLFAPGGPIYAQFALLMIALSSLKLYMDRHEVLWSTIWKFRHQLERKGEGTTPNRALPPDTPREGAE